MIEMSAILRAVRVSDGLRMSGDRPAKLAVRSYHGYNCRLV